MRGAILLLTKLDDKWLFRKNNNDFFIYIGLVFSNCCISCGYAIRKIIGYQGAEDFIQRK